MTTDYLRLADGRDLRGVKWEVGVFDAGLIITIDSPGAWQLNLEGAEREKFAEAVARAVTPGQVTP